MINAKNTTPYNCTEREQAHLLAATPCDSQIAVMRSRVSRLVVVCTINWSPYKKTPSQGYVQTPG
jgi:hypothetical protein